MSSVVVLDFGVAERRSGRLSGECFSVPDVGPVNGSPRYVVSRGMVMGVACGVVLRSESRMGTYVDDLVLTGASGRLSCVLGAGLSSQLLMLVLVLQAGVLGRLLLCGTSLV